MEISKLQQGIPCPFDWGQPIRADVQKSDQL